MKARHKRFGFLLAGMAGLGLAAWLIFNALDSNLSYYFSPTDVVQNKAPAGHVFRLGGLVEKGSLQRGQELTVRFVVSDGPNNPNRVNVAYTGILPDLFKEGQGVIAQGRMGADGVFIADEVLAKHDENYMPPEVADSLNKANAQGVVDAAAKEMQR